jgi:hypothetical protein
LFFSFLSLFHFSIFPFFFKTRIILLLF